ncbi:hypothetical protein E2C01_013911 [Portunus trituberculatus]|uniref:Uncharacterized protein n=1 Tax=Portunus trituberculatus TaxID=210409 RepID=A0A5B7DID4_PORTR|nr:hypothetical protein [Portunus trituberculatus]
MEVLSSTLLIEDLTLGNAEKKRNDKSIRLILTDLGEGKLLTSEGDLVEAKEDLRRRLSERLQELQEIGARGPVEVDHLLLPSGGEERQEPVEGKSGKGQQKRLNKKAHLDATSRAGPRELAKGMG